MHMRKILGLALPSALLFSWMGPAAAEEPTTPAPAPAPTEAQAPGGDARRIVFASTFADALARAKREKRLLFLKPIYGGVDAAGAKDYRCGSW